jgi:hypothetical protein
LELLDVTGYELVDDGYEYGEVAYALPLALPNCGGEAPAGTVLCPVVPEDAICGARLLDGILNCGAELASATAAFSASFCPHFQKAMLGKLD